MQSLRIELLYALARRGNKAGLGGVGESCTVLEMFVMFVGIAVLVLGLVV